MEQYLQRLLVSACSPWPLIGLAAAVAVGGAFIPRNRMLKAYAFAISAFLAVTGALAAFAPTTGLAFYILAIIPATLIAQHAVYLAYVKNPFSNEGRRLDAIPEDFLPNRIQSGLSQARQTSERDFGWSTLGLRFGVPAILIVVVIGCFASPLYSAQSSAWLWGDTFVRGARYGGAGAYVYVLLYLSRRNFRHDITSSAAVWSAVDLVVGPVLGGILALLWKAQGAAEGTFASSVVFFAAGLAPKHIASGLEEAAKRLLRTDDRLMLPAARVKPLTTLRGVTPAIAERLEEAGIEDAFGMAMADPARLMRNTPFDQRQIVSWIDEAILIAAFPQKWEVLESLGVTGAIDLAWYCDIVLDGEREVHERKKAVAAPESASGSPAPPQPLLELAEEAKINPSLLWSIAQRFYWDGQVQLVWVLYQIGAEGVQVSSPGLKSAEQQQFGDSQARAA
jgi:hypothetical protein